MGKDSQYVYRNGHARFLGLARSMGDRYRVGARDWLPLVWAPGLSTEAT